jgi:hypothetical protein
MFLYEINLPSETTPTGASSTGASSSSSGASSSGYPPSMIGAPVKGAPGSQPVLTGGDSHYDKYMKYKMKYLELKNR